MPDIRLHHFSNYLSHHIVLSNNKLNLKVWYHKRWLLWEMYRFTTVYVRKSWILSYSYQLFFTALTATFSHFSHSYIFWIVRLDFTFFSFLLLQSRRITVRTSKKRAVENAVTERKCFESLFIHTKRLHLQLRPEMLDLMYLLT